MGWTAPCEGTSGGMKWFGYPALLKGVTIRGPHTTPILNRSRPAHFPPLRFSDDTIRQQPRVALCLQEPPMRVIESWQRDCV